MLPYDLSFSKCTLYSVIYEASNKKLYNNKLVIVGFPEILKTISMDDNYCSKQKGSYLYMFMYIFYKIII